MKYWIIYLFLVILALGCSKHNDEETPIIEVPEEPTELSENAISFHSSLSSDKNLQTRSMLPDTLTQLSEANGNLYIIAVRYKTKSGTVYGADAEMLIANDRLLLEQPLRDTVNGDIIYREFEQGFANNHYYWPECTLTDPGDKVDFYSYFVSSATGSGGSNVDADCQTLLVDYTLRSSDIKKQIDLLYDANPENITGLCKKPRVVPDIVHLKMKHALAQIRFRIASSTHSDIRIEKVSIDEVLCSGQFDLSQRKWISNTNSNSLILYPKDGDIVTPNGLGTENASEKYISSALIPTTWTDKKINVEIANGNEFCSFEMTICKGGKELEAGHIYDFVLNYNGKVVELSDPTVINWDEEDGGIAFE